MRYKMNNSEIIADLSEYTISTGIYDHLYSEHCDKLKNDVTIPLSIDEQIRIAFYAGMKAAQKLIEKDNQ
jgi:hypothetical protein